MSENKRKVVLKFKKASVFIKTNLVDVYFIHFDFRFGKGLGGKLAKGAVIGAGAYAGYKVTLLLFQGS